MVEEIDTSNKNINTQTVVVKTSGGFFSSMFKAIGCCIGILIVLGIIIAIANSH